MLTLKAAENSLLSPVHWAKGLTPTLSLDVRGDALTVSHAVSWSTDLWGSTDLGAASPCMLSTPKLAATGFVSADPFSLPCPSCAALWAAGWKLVGHSKKRDRLPLWAPAVPRNWKMLLRWRRGSNHQKRGVMSRCWGNVSLPQLGKVLTTIMAESLCNPFFSLLFTPAKAISKFKVVTGLRWEGDDYRAQ